MGVEMELDFQRRASTNRQTFEQDRFPWKNELLLCPRERKMKREKAAEKNSIQHEKVIIDLNGNEALIFISYFLIVMAT